VPPQEPAGKVNLTERVSGLPCKLTVSV